MGAGASKNGTHRFSVLYYPLTQGFSKKETGPIEIILDIYVWPKRKYSYIMITRLHTSLRLQNSATYASNCFHMHRICRVWFPVD